MASPAVGPQDALVTLSCDPRLPLENRIELLSYAFTRAVKGDILRKVISWDIAHGTVAFILAPKRLRRHPRGVIFERLEDVGEVSAELRAA